MLQVENEEYERILKNSKVRGGGFSKQCRKTISQFHEVAEKLDVFEVEFIISMRALDKKMQYEIKSVVNKWFKDRLKFYLIIDKMLTASEIS